MTDKTQCPMCKSTKTKKYGASQFKNAVQVFKNRVGEDCGTVWQPECPRAMAIFLIVAGIVFPFVWLAMQHAISRGMNDVNALMPYTPSHPAAQPVWGNPLANWIWIAMCVLILIHGIRILRGKAGKLEILGNTKMIKNNQTDVAGKQNLQDRLKSGNPSEWPDNGKEYLIKRTGEAFSLDATLEEIKSGVMAGIIKKDWGVRKRTDGVYD